MSCPTAGRTCHTTVHLLCGSGKRSRQAAVILTGHGYDTVNIAGGITEWYRNGDPVTYTTQPQEHPPGPQTGIREVRS